MTYDKDGTILLGQIDDLEQDIGEIFRFLIPVMSPSAWLTANQEENAINGLALTKGGFTKGISSIFCENYFNSVILVCTVLEKKRPSFYLQDNL